MSRFYMDFHAADRVSLDTMGRAFDDLPSARCEAEKMVVELAKAWSFEQRRPSSVTIIIRDENGVALGSVRARG